MRLKIGISPLISVLLFSAASHVFAQSNFVLNKDAKRIGDSLFQLTPSTAWKSGSVWYQKRLDLRSDFIVIAELNFGDRVLYGADGMAFVLQPLSSNQGSSGGGMGYWKIKPSLSVEFDDFYNPTWDPEEDHIALVKDGDIFHYTSNTISGPHKLSYSIEDGKWHSAVFQWTASTKKFRCLFDGTEIFNQSIQMIKDVFNDSNFVYFGFTGATGDKYNAQQVKIDSFALKVEAFCNLGIDTALVEHVSCFGGNNGKIHISDTGGYGPVTYKWNPTSIGNTSKAANLKAGRYLVTATDTQGCKDMLWVNVNEPNPITTDIISTKSACKGSNSGEIELSSKNHNGDLTWEISPKLGTINSFISGANVKYTGIPAGTYIIIQTDTLNCQDTSIVEVEVGAKIYGKIDTSNSTCSNLSLGSIETSALTGIPPFSWNIMPNLGTQTQTNKGQFSEFKELPKNQYVIYLVDSVGCRDTLITQIENQKVIVSTIDSIGESCEVFNGYISATTNNGILPYQWNISPVIGDFNGSNRNAEFSQLQPGKYTINITDALGCIDTLEAEVLNYSISANITSSSLACNLGKLGTINTQCSNGTLPLNWIIEPNDGSIKSNPSNYQIEFTELKASSYNIVVSDANGCRDTVSTIIEENKAESKVTYTKKSCFKGEKGIIEASGIKGTQPYNWSITPNISSITKNNDPPDVIFSNVPANNYLLIMTDNNGCLDSHRVDVEQFEKINLSIDSFSGSINDGELTFHTSVSPTGQYFYYWTPLDVFGGQSTSSKPTIKISQGRSIQLQVLDTNGCFEIASYQVFDPSSEIHYYAPNAFTPDENSVNDYYKVKGNFNTVNYKVFNRWGECLFVSSPSNPEWDGKYQGEFVPEGVYVIISDMYWNFQRIRKVVGTDVTVLR